ncbi:MAG: phosphocholine-specific phospholipase C, partial [Tepidisphaeraceae bacterium]
GYNDPRAIHLPNGNPVWAQSDKAGQTFIPFRLNINDTRATWMGALPHHWQSQVDARNDGLYDRWLPAKRSNAKAYAPMPLTLGHYTRDDIPFYYELADAFTVCDQHFCSSLTGTTPNRLHLWTGTLRAEQSVRAQANVVNEDADFDHPVRWTTFPERLEDHGVSWKIYQNELGVDSGLTTEEDPWLSNFGDNPIEYFSQYNVRLSKTHRDFLRRQVDELPAAIAQLKQQLDRPDLSAKDRATLTATLEKTERALSRAVQEQRQYNAEAFEKLSPRDRRLHEKAFCINDGDPDYRTLAELTYTDGDAQHTLRVPKGDLFHQFRKDVQTGQLPTVSWLVAPERFSDHPQSAWYGAWYIAEAMNILTQNPEVWKKTIFILTYDENDGYFDHAPPFVAPHPRKPETGRVSEGIDTALEYVELEQDRQRVPHSSPRESPVGLGFRVPMVVASPWSRGGCVCSQVFDHTSVLQFLEKFITHKTARPLVESNISAWRRTVCGDLTSVFRSSGQADVPLKFPARDDVLTAIDRAKHKPLPAGFHALSAEQVAQLRQDVRAFPLMPRQEPGVRPAAPLPYELQVDAKLSEDGNRILLSFRAGKSLFGERSAGAPFTVYAVLGEGKMQVRNYAVAAGGMLEDSWNLKEFADSGYHLRVHGPNGFYREFRGTRAAAGLAIVAGYPRDAAGKATGDFQIQMTNASGQAPLNVVLTDRSYQAPPVHTTLSPAQSAQTTIGTRSSAGWYDVAITSEALPGFECRFAGHVET